MCIPVYTRFSDCSHEVASYIDFCDDSEGDQPCGNMEERQVNDSPGVCFKCHDVKEGTRLTKEILLHEQELRLAIQESEEMAKHQGHGSAGFDEDELEQAIENSLETSPEMQFYICTSVYSECGHRQDDGPSDIPWDPASGDNQELVTEAQGLCDLCTVERIEQVHQEQIANDTGEGSCRSDRRRAAPRPGVDDEAEAEDAVVVEPMTLWKQRPRRPPTPEMDDPEPDSKGKGVVRAIGPAETKEADDELPGYPGDVEVPLKEAVEVEEVSPESQPAEAEPPRLGGGHHPLLDRLEKEVKAGPDGEKEA
jgi:hypothetical protein